MQNKNITLYTKNNLPIIPSLLKNKYKDIVEAYFGYIYETENIINSANVQNVIKLEYMNNIEDAFYKKNSSEKYKTVTKLRDEFEKEFIVPAIFMDSLSALKKDAANFSYQTWGQLLDYCINSSGTNARFLLSLYEENPSTYNPANSLCVAYKLLQIIANLKDDTKILNRLYIPSEIMKKYNLSLRSFSTEYSNTDVKAMIDEILERVKGLLKDANILPSIIKDTNLKIVFCILLSKTHILLRKIRKNDILSKKITLSTFDNINIFLTGFTEGFL